MGKALPGCIISVAGDAAEVDIDGIVIRADVSLIAAPLPGDWVLLHSGVAIARIDPHAAQVTLRSLQTLDCTA